MKIIQMVNLMLILILSSCSDGWIVHTDNKNKFTLSYLDTWQKQIDGEVTILLSPKENKEDEFQENINVMVQDLSNHSLTLEEYTKLTKEQIVNGLGQESILSLKDMNFVGQKSKNIVYAMPMSVGSNKVLDLKVQQLWFLKYNKAYLITYTAEIDKYDKFLAIAEQTIDSFKLQ